MAGDFVVQRQDRYGFAQIACAMAIEQTFNCDSKTKGGMKGLITLKKGAVNRWLLSHHKRATTMKECKFMASKDQEGRVQKYLHKARIERDEQDLQSLVATIQAMVNHLNIRERISLASHQVVLHQKIPGTTLSQHTSQDRMVPSPLLKTG